MYSLVTMSDHFSCSYLLPPCMHLLLVNRNVHQIRRGGGGVTCGTRVGPMKTVAIDAIMNGHCTSANYIVLSDRWLLMWPLIHN